MRNIVLDNAMLFVYNRNAHIRNIVHISYNNRAYLSRGDSVSRVILHCDMNNFFASVECLLNPALRGKRVAVCGSIKERHGIVLAKNEAAKKLGVKTGEAIWEAERKCPGLVIVEPNYDNYIYYSKRAREIYNRYTDLVEPFGLDECWLDVTGSQRIFGDGRHIADEIRAVIKRELGLTVSVGVSFNKVLAKLGSELFKCARENNVIILYEAAVAGGIPIIMPVKTIVTSPYIIEQITSEPIKPIGRFF